MVSPVCVCVIKRSLIKLQNETKKIIKAAIPMPRLVLLSLQTKNVFRCILARECSDQPLYMQTLIQEGHGGTDSLT